MCERECKDKLPFKETAQGWSVNVKRLLLDLMMY